MNPVAFLASLVLVAGGTFPDAAVLALLEHSYGLKGSEPIVCLQVDGKDPSDALLSRIASLFPFVIKGSDCVAGSAAAQALGERQRGRLWLGDFNESASGVATAKVSAHFGPRAAGGWTVHFVKTDTGWSVESVDADVVY